MLLGSTSSPDSWPPAALGGGLGLAAATALPPRAARTTAQEATPEVMRSTDPRPSADAPVKTAFLFVQPFASGTWAPKAGEDGVFTLTLSGTAAQTVYFSDRPERVFGLTPTGQFLARLGFTPANPPNAALVARTAGGEEEGLVVELLNPVHDAAAGTLTYDAKVLADYDGAVLAHAARPTSPERRPSPKAGSSSTTAGTPWLRATRSSPVRRSRSEMSAWTRAGNPSAIVASVPT